MYCDKLVGVGRDEKIRMKLFMRSLKGDALSWYISQDSKKWTSWNLKKKPTKNFREYAIRWRSEAAKVRPALEEEQMNRFFVRAQDPQYYERLMLIEGQRFSDIIKLGERIEEGIKNGMVTNLEALQATNKALQSGGSSKKKDVNFVMAAQKKEPAPNVRNNPLPDHEGRGIHMIEIKDDWDPKGSIGLIAKGDEPKKPIVTLNPIVVQIQPSEGDVVNVSVPLKFEAPPSKAPKPIEVEFGVARVPMPFEVTVLPPKAPIPVSMTDVTPFKTNAIPWDYTAEARRKGKTYTGEVIAAQGMTRTGRVYTPEHLAASIKQASGRNVETGPDDLWRKVQAKEYSFVEQLNKTPAQISILTLLQSSEAHKNALIKVLSEAYVPSNITRGKIANMVGQVLESHKITFHEDELPPEGLGHNKVLHITVQYEDHFVTRILVDGGANLNICPLVTLRTLAKGLHEIKDWAISVKDFDGSQRTTIGEIILCLQMGPTWFDVEFQVIDVPASYNLLLGRPWIHVVGAVASTLHQAVKFEWNQREVIIDGDGSNPIYSRQAIPMIGGRRKIDGETYHHIERVNAIDKDKWWDNKIESILNWSGYEPGKGLGKNLQGITKPIKLKKHEEDEALAAIKNLFLEDDMDFCVIFEEEVEEGPSIQAMNQGEHLANWSIRTTTARRASGITITYLDDEPMTLTCNETVRQMNIDSEEDEIPEEVVREVKNFENRPKSNLDETEVINLGNAENVKETRISIHLSPSEKEEYTKFLKEYEDIFAWSYDDMTGLSTSIVAHKLPTDPACYQSNRNSENSSQT
ncbi:uncharacterized protein [Nicotiana sylvestris]|uniref:uncharacterized protein n=1 Tax=Nicotiana sylvestris TaxID=4096 RepID=UPI00388C9C9A